MAKVLKSNVSNEVVELSGIGPVILSTSNKWSRLTIRVRPFKGIEVCIPHGTAPMHVAQFMKTNSDWMKRALTKIKSKEQELTIFDENTLFSTRTFSLRIESAQRDDVNLKFSNGMLHVHYPLHMNVKTSSIQSAIRHGIVEALRIEAKKYLPERLKELAFKHSFKFKQVFIKNLKSRWGSCSSVNNINLNLHLMRLPDHLIDYVILHELCHTREKNHGSGFWNLMNHVTNGRAVNLENEMKQYRTVIY
ncbi:MAG: M48 family metallopeptidase [Marinilabiliaceae bacterium]|nr:M48 family metallopeptidase [Marinilabiliaceae bacterium]